MERLTNFDYFSTGFTIYFKGKENYRTKIGGTISILTMLLFITYFYFSGIEVFYKEKPSDTMTILVNTVPEDITMSIPISVLIENSKGTFQDDWQRIYNVDSNFYDLINQNGIFTDRVSPYQMKMRFCNKSDFSSEVSNQYHQMALDLGYCFDEQNVTLGGDFSGDYVRYINMTISICKNSSMNNNSCLPSDQIYENLYNDNNLALHYETLSYSASNYANPIKKILIQDNYAIDQNVCKILNYHVQKFIIYSDSGILISKMTKKEFYQFDYISTDFVLNSQDSKEKCLFKFTFQSSLYTRTQVRTYLKLSGAIAEIGGALNAYLIFFTIIFRYLYLKRMKEMLITSLFKDKRSSKSSDYVDLFHKNLMNDLNFSSKKEIFEKSNITQGKLMSNNREDGIINSTLNNRNTLIKMNKGSEVYILNKNINSEQGNNTKFNINNEDGKNKQEIMNVSNMNNNHQRISEDLKLKTQNNILEDNELKRIDKMKFTFFQYVLFCFCGCFLNQTLHIRRRNFEELFNFSIKYFDIVEIVRKLHEFERLKYVVFNKEQIAIFNSIAQPSNPLIKSDNLDTLTKRLKFDNDKEAQKEIINKVLNHKSDNNDERTTKRLLKLKCNV
jgi:hypothetical protein